MITWKAWLLAFFGVVVSVGLVVTGWFIFKDSEGTQVMRDPIPPEPSYGQVTDGLVAIGYFH